MVTFLIILIVLETIGLIFLGIRILAQKSAIRKIVENANEISKKNVEVEDLDVSGSKDIKHLAYSINMIKSNLLAFIESTKGNVITLTDAIDILSNASKANEQGAEQTSNTITTVAEKATEQLDLVKDNLDLIAANSTELDNIQSSMTSISKLLKESVESCDAGIVHLEDYEVSMSQISKNLSESVRILEEFNDQIVQVNSIGELIVDVTEELNLLALNASIEAARAGEAGKGFGVVSQEMSIMSEKTKSNMDAISEILTKVTESSMLVNNSINECNNTFNESSAVFKELSNSLKLISSQSSDINSSMGSISKKYDLIAQNSDVSKEKAENVFSASEVISDSTRDIVAVSEETTAGSAQISENVTSLESMLTSLTNLIRQFNTGIAPTAKNRSEKVRIAFFSKLDNYFWFAIRRGVMYAQKELKNNNVEVVYFPYKDDIEEKSFPNDVIRCTKEHFDAIIYPGFLSLADKEISEAAKAGVKIFTYNCDCGKNIKRVSCYEPDQEEAGIMAAKAAAKAIKKSGKIAIVAGDLSAAVNKIRYDSFVNYIKNNYKDISIVTTVEVTYDPEDTYKKEVQLIKNNPGINLIYSTTGMQIQLAKAIMDTGNTGKIKAVVFDQNDEIFDCINKGVIAAAIDHDPFSQGHDPIIYMYNHIVDGLKLPHDRIKCKASIVDSDNIKDRISC